MKLKCLIIEDSAIDREILIKLVKKAWEGVDIELEIVACGTFEEGLMESLDANVTILDLNLPDSEEKDTIQRIKMFRPPVIVLTGDCSPEAIVACRESGADHVFCKGNAFGFISAFFEAMQKDIIRTGARV